MQDSFKSKRKLKSGSEDYTYWSLPALGGALGAELSALPYSIRVLLENLLRNEDDKSVTRSDIEALAKWNPKEKSAAEIAYTPARVVLQDFTGVPAVVDFAAMRDSISRMGGDPRKINPLQPVDLVIDHSVQVDAFGSASSFEENVSLEFKRNSERYQFLKWGQQAFENFRVVPPGMGIVHQVNLESLATLVFMKKTPEGNVSYPDTLVGTDSHTTMINGLGVLGWGVGGIEAEAAMLGQPISMLIPQVVGFKLEGKLPSGATATDLVLTVTQMLRAKGVVGKFVEFYGPGLAGLPLADRATIANMAPEYGATMGFFPVDEETIRYMRLTGRDENVVELAEAYYKAQGLFRTVDSPEPQYTDTLELALESVEPSLAGPKRPQDRVLVREAKQAFQAVLPTLIGKQGKGGGPPAGKAAAAAATSVKTDVDHGSVVIAAITSCTNTSNPYVMLGAGLLAKKAVERGLKVKPWVKTSLAPGSQVVTEYLKAAGVLESLEALNFHLVGYGCTTCIGNSGPLPAAVAQEVQARNLVAVSVLSGNRNFEGRVNPLVKANYLASPPLVVAYALAGTMNINLIEEPLGEDAGGNPVYLKDIWPANEEIKECVAKINGRMFRSKYDTVFEGEAQWKAVDAPSGDTFAWSDQSTYIKNPPYFDGMEREPQPLVDIKDGRVLVMVGDSVTTDHISPAGAIPKDSPAGRYLIEKGVEHRDFNSYGSRRGNHEVMMRGTFGNIRLRNLLAPGTEGGLTRLIPQGEQMSIYDAALKYQLAETPLLVLAGKEYGTGSSRDWAAKGPALLGIKAVIAESFERIHRSNLIGMGILPLEFQPGQSREDLGLSGEEKYSISGIAEGLKPGAKLRVVAGDKQFTVVCRIDTPVELAYYQHGGILKYVLRQLLNG